MKRAEKEERKARIQERLLELASIMSKSDAHASKCIKLGVSFKNVYPEEYKEYTQAREDYNQLEKELVALESVEVEEEISDDNKQSINLNIGGKL